MVYIRVTVYMWVIEFIYIYNCLIFGLIVLQETSQSQLYLGSKAKLFPLPKY